MTIDRQQITARLMHFAEEDLEKRDMQVGDTVIMFAAKEHNLGKLIEYILEMIDPAYGTGRYLPPSYEVERRNFCAFLKAGNYLEAHEAIPKIRAIGLLEAGNVTEDLNGLSEADIDTCIALTHAATAVFFYAIRSGALPGTWAEVIPVDAVITPFCFAVKRLLSAHSKESGQAAMQSILGYIADRLATVLNGTQQ